MLMGAKNQLKITLLSVKYALQREMLNKVTFFTNIIFMILNNACFLVQWIILFIIREGIGGYSFRQVVLLWGLAASTFGFSHFFFKDSYNLSSIINEGRLDNYLVQPKNVLLSLITSSVEVSCIGDIIYGVIMIFVYGFELKTFLLFSLFSVLGGLIITSSAVIWGSLAFWFGKVDMVADTMTGLPTSFATYPDGIFKGIVRVLFYTIIPIGFANYMPINVITNFNLYYLLVVIVMTIVFVTLAFIVFYSGLRRYSSSNLMNVRV